jgi:ATP-dependent Lhr-like helicase
MMSSQSSNSKKRSSAFFLLDNRIRRWIWEAGWAELRDIQELAIPIIIEGVRDVIIAAATASGKTEAAFFPILTRMLGDTERGMSTIYVSPLKALINDQWGRLEQLCDLLKIPVVPWHGDISESRKRRFVKEPHGCILITPESLEGLLIRHGNALSSLFRGLQYIVVDELHAFIDTERGKQLQSLMNRIEVALRKRVPRIGLSATLGDMRLAADYLRPASATSVYLIESRESGQELKVLVKGYYSELSEQAKARAQVNGADAASSGVRTSVIKAASAISRDLFAALRGTNNLIFPNSRANVELYSDILRRLCEDLGVPNEFWPHHGSLSREIREDVERRIKTGVAPSTAIATTTLELGIDIGAVKSVAQIGPSPSVSSLRQRLGRSGRRKGEPAVLRCYCLEDELNVDSSFSDQLREGLVQTIAQIRLLTRSWFEPPRTNSLHLSTLIQQLLSLIAQYGGVNASESWEILVNSGVFLGIEKKELAELLRWLGTKDILSQDQRGLLLLGSAGERIVNHYGFLAAFTSPEEFRILHSGKALGTLPISRPLKEGSYIIFAGRRWQVISCRPKEKIIEVEPAKGGKPPTFDGMGGKVHDGVRKEMRSVLRETSPVPFLEKIASRLLEEARLTYSSLNLEHEGILRDANDAVLFSWRGDWVNDALALMLMRLGLKAANEGLCIRIFGADPEEVLGALNKVCGSPRPNPEQLADLVQNKLKEKWDYLLTDGLLKKNYASRELDLDGANQFILEISRSHAK